jgi:hypothetical protein
MAQPNYSPTCHIFVTFPKFQMKSAVSEQLVTNLHNKSALFAQNLLEMWNLIENAAYLKQKASTYVYMYQG